MGACDCLHGNVYIVIPGAAAAVYISTLINTPINTPVNTPINTPDTPIKKAAL